MDKEPRNVLDDAVDEFEYGQEVLKSLLYYGSKENNFKLPTIERYIFNEVIKGTIEFVTGEESKFICPTYIMGKDGKKYLSTKTDNFEPNMWDYFKQEFTRGNRKLNPKIRRVLFRALEPRWSSDRWGDGEYKTELYQYFNGPWDIGFCDVHMKSTFSLPYEVVNDVENKFLPLLSEPEKKDIEGIGKCMKKYIDEDLKYIKKEYHW